MSQEKVDKIVNILRQEATRFCEEHRITDPTMRLIIEQSFVKGGMIAMREALQDIKGYVK